MRNKYSALVAGVRTSITAVLRTLTPESIRDTFAPTVVSGVNSQQTNSLSIEGENSVETSPNDSVIYGWDYFNQYAYFNEPDNDVGGVLPDDVRPQTGGDHYQLPIQPLDYITENNLDYLQGNVVKYVTRHKSKNGAEDILKAIDYCIFILEKDYDTKRKIV